ncbi:MAG: hypothetical protein JWM93_1385, partial [Frankiales bacterium]|nr:hypothetical protein [Frankiales bacterium]
VAINGITQPAASKGQLITPWMRVVQITPGKPSADGGAVVSSAVLRIDGVDRTLTDDPEAEPFAAHMTCGPATYSTFKKRSLPVTLPPSPTNGGIVRAGQPTFVWNDYLGITGQPLQEAREYRVQVSTDPSFETLLLDTKDAADLVDFDQLTPPSVAIGDGRYYWRVAAIDNSLNLLTWSAPASFIKDSQAPVATLSEPLELAGYNFVDFSEPVTGVDSSTVGIALANSGSKVAGKVYAQTPTRAVFVPTTPLTAGDSYVAWVSKNVQDVVGNAAVADPRIVEAPLVVDSGGGDIEENWDRDANAAASGDAYIQSAMKGATVEVPFTGSSVAVYGMRAPDGGYATVKVDGVVFSTVSFYASTRQWQRKLVNVTGLTSGFHHLTLVVTGKAPTLSKGTSVFVDAFATQAGRFEENASQVLQWWSNRRATDAYGSDYDTTSYAASGDTGARPSGVAYVKGSSVAVVGCKSPDSGKVQVVLDGRAVATVDLYQSYTSCGQKFYSHSLTSGRHSVKLVLLGSRNARSTGNRVSIDVIKVTA